MANGLYPARCEAIRALTAAGKSVAEIVEELGVGRSTVHRVRRRDRPADGDDAADWRPAPGPRYTCDTCGHRTTAESALAPTLACEQCGGLAYPPLSDAEVNRRLTALVKRLEAEERDGWGGDSATR